MSTDADHFCLALKAARERTGMTLDQIAETTKIPASLFAALERNDLRRWPKGLFRRSFFRDYARTIGLPVAEACDAFVQLFPDECTVLTTPSGSAEPATRADDIRLVLDQAWHGPRASIVLRLLAVLSDAGVVIAVPRRRSMLEALTPEPAEEPEPRTWVSDARRVGRARLRVRIKVSH